MIFRTDPKDLACALIGLRHLYRVLLEKLLELLICFNKNQYGTVLCFTYIKIAKPNDEAPRTSPTCDASFKKIWNCALVNLTMKSILKGLSVISIR